MAWICAAILGILLLLMPTGTSAAYPEDLKGTVVMQDTIAVLENKDDSLRAEIDLTNGTVRSVSLDGRPVFAAIGERIRLFYEGAGDSTFTLSECTVISFKEETGILVLTLQHSVLSERNMELEVRYWLSEHRMCRNLILKNRGTRLWFAEGHVECELQDTFRSGGYYYLPWPSGRPLVEADGIKQNTQDSGIVYAPHSTAMTGLYQPESDLTAVSTLVAQNGEFAGTSYTQRHNLTDSALWKQDQPVLTPKGWVHRTNRSSLPAGRTFSYEVDFYVTPGDTTRFFTIYLNHPLLRKASQGNLSGQESWASEVKYTQYILPGYAWLSESDPGNRLFFKRLSTVTGSGLSQGLVMTLVNYYGWTGGTHPSNEETAEMKSGTGYFSEQYDNVRIGQFDFSALVPNYNGKVTDLFVQHPEWAINGSSSGKRFAQWYPEEGTFYPEGRYTFQYALEEVLDHIESSAVSIAKETAPQFVYLEDKESAFAPDFDYGNGLVFTDADNREALTRYRDALHDAGALLWINDPDSVVGDMVQLEMASGVWQPGLETWENWRTVSDALYLAKARQDAYADGAVNLIYPYEYDRYFSYALAYAAIPNFAPSGLSDLNNEIVPLMPFVNARYEIHDAVLVDGSADYEPSWRKDGTVSTDVVGLTIGENGGILTAIRNAPGTVTQTVSADSRALHVDPERITFLWELSMTNPGPSYDGFSQPVNTRVLPKRQDADAPAVVTDKLTISSGGERIEAALTLEPYLARMICASNVPGYIESVDGYALQYKLPEALGVRLSGSCPEKGAYSMDVLVNGPENAVVAVYLRENAMSLSLDGSPVSFEPVEWNGHTFALVPVTSGAHTVRVDPDGQAEETDAQPGAPAGGNPARFSTGQVLALILSGGFSAAACGLAGFLLGRRKAGA